MRSISKAWPVGLLVLVLASAGPLFSEEANNTCTDSIKIKIIVLHMNDIYEITPLKQGTVGGLARVATVYKDLKKDNPYVYALHAGDFLSPSAIGNAKVDGKRLAGKQMVSVLKAAGIDFVIFGNHEFDLDKTDFDERLQELTELKTIPELKEFPELEAVKQFEERRRALFSTNVSDLQEKPFKDVPRYRIIEVKDPKDRSVLLRIGLIGLTTKSTKKKGNFATFKPPIAAAEEQLKLWEESKEKLDLVIALTHQSLDADEELARRFPNIDLILGGHEHENTHRRVIPDRNAQEDKDKPHRLASIYRADANARTVYVHELCYNTKERRLERVDSKLKIITDGIPEDSRTAALVKDWVRGAYPGLHTYGLDPDEELTTLTEDLDGRESSVRNRRTNLTDLVGDAMLKALKGGSADIQFAIYNSGSIRIDDVIPAGPIIGYDVFRILPFPGDVWSVNMSGDRAAKLLNEKDEGKDTGAFLQTRNVSWQGEGKDRVWLINGKKLDPNQTYQMAINSYLLEGLEEGFEFLSLPKTDSDGQKIGDWRKIVADHLRQMKGHRPPDGALAQKVALQIQPLEVPPVQVPKSGSPPTSDRQWVWLAIAIALGPVLGTTVGWAYGRRLVWRQGRPVTSPSRKFMRRFGKLLNKGEELATPIAVGSASGQEWETLYDLAARGSTRVALLQAWGHVQLAMEGRSVDDNQRKLSFWLGELHKLTIGSPYEPLPAHTHRYINLALNIAEQVKKFPPP